MNQTKRGKRSAAKFTHEHSMAMHDALARAVARADAIEREAAARTTAAFRLFVREARALLSAIEVSR